MKNLKTNKITNKTYTLHPTWTYEAIENLGKKLHEEPLTEEERIIERLKYTKKELDDMYSQSLDDIIAEEMSVQIAKEIDNEILNQILRDAYGKTSTGTR